MIGFNMGRFVLLVYMYTRSEFYLRFDSSGTENRDFTGKNVFHGFHGSTVDFTGLPQKQPISRTRDTVKKEGPCQEILRIVFLAGCGLIESEAQILMVCDGLPHDIVNNNDEKERS